MRVPIYHFQNTASLRRGSYILPSQRILLSLKYLRVISISTGYNKYEFTTLRQYNLGNCYIVCSMIVLGRGVILR